ncbi:hypothetical protein KKB83_02200 [Patescibacteria group bacterium]|nr:hypothetical protein [Patescibacteria group bacterium]
MKKIIGVSLLTMFLVGFAATAALAGGDKVRGENGQGDTVQSCLNFEGCPYGDENPLSPSTP